MHATLDSTFSQDTFDLTIGRLDRVLSVLVNHAKANDLDAPNRQTLKHHAEDMASAAECILNRLKGVEGTPQPEVVMADGPGVTGMTPEKAAQAVADMVTRRQGTTPIDLNEFNRRKHLGQSPAPVGPMTELNELPKAGRERADLVRATIRNHTRGEPMLEVIDIYDYKRRQAALPGVPFPQVRDALELSDRLLDETPKVQRGDPDYHGCGPSSEEIGAAIRAGRPRRDDDPCHESTEGRNDPETYKRMHAD